MSQPIPNNMESMNRFEEVQSQEPEPKASEPTSGLAQGAVTATGILGGLASIVMSVPQVGGLAQTLLQSLQNLAGDGDVLNHHTVTNHPNVMTAIQFAPGGLEDNDQGKIDGHPNMRDVTVSHKVFAIGRTTAAWSYEPITGESASPLDRASYYYVEHSIINHTTKQMTITPFLVGSNSWSRICCLCESPERFADFMRWADQFTITGREFLDEKRCSFEDKAEPVDVDHPAGRYYSVKATTQFIDGPPALEHQATSCDHYAIVFKTMSGSGEDEIKKAFEQRQWFTKKLETTKSISMNLDSTANWHWARCSKSLDLQAKDLTEMFKNRRSVNNSVFVVTCGPRLENWTSMKFVPKDEHAIRMLTLLVSGVADHWAYDFDCNPLDAYNPELNRSVTTGFDPESGELTVVFPKPGGEHQLDARVRMFDGPVAEFNAAKSATSTVFATALNRIPKNKEGKPLYGDVEIAHARQIIG